MTTIAFKNGIVAADTGMTTGGSQISNMVKIVQNDSGDVLGGCGDASLIYAFQRWFLGGEKEQRPEVRKDGDRDNGTAVIFRATGEILQYDSYGYHAFSAPFYAIGSGRCEALGAMCVGATAEEAVRAAIQLDDSTFGDVTLLHLVTP